MHKIGVISDEELVRAYEELGYDITHAKKMADFTVKYNQSSDKTLTKSEILKGYTENIIKYEDAALFLVDMGYNENETNYLLSLEDYKRDKALLKQRLDNVKWRFQNNVLTETQTRDKLGQLGLTGSQISTYLESWIIDRIDDIKHPSKADLDKLIAAKIINLVTYTDQMYKLGFNTKYIEWYVKLLGTKQKES